MTLVAASHSLFEIDAELDSLLEQMQEEVELRGEASKELTERFQGFCRVHEGKIDRLGRFLHMMEAREQFCRSEAARLTDRARATAGMADRTKSMVLFYLLSRELKKVEGREFTLRVQKNSQDSVKIIDEAALPIAFCTVDLRMDGVLWETVLSHLPDELAKTVSCSIQNRRPDSGAIKGAAARHEQVPGTELRRGFHLRVA